jgi:preprotein translocase subunit SecF
MSDQQRYRYRQFDFDFVGKLRYALILSVVLSVGAVAALIWRGLDFGIDFTGGTLVELGYQAPPDLDAIRAALARSEFGSAAVQNFGSPTDVLVRLPPSGDVGAAELSTRILAVLPEAEMRRIEFVGPQVGEELAESGVIALLIAFAGIFVYVMVRFTWKFSLGAIVATVHDVLLTVALFAVTGIEFDLTVLAAVLAVLGYSLNDTVVVFDRIRENFRKLRKGSPGEIVNRSLNQTLSRTLVTGTTTLIVLFALFFLGGEMIGPFSIALIFGIVIGTYSSIFVASAMLILLGVTKIDLMPVQVEGAPVDDRP